jgi:hypothetical protein
MSAMDLSKIEVIIDKINYIFKDIKLSDTPEKNDIKLFKKYVSDLVNAIPGNMDLDIKPSEKSATPVKNEGMKQKDELSEKKDSVEISTAEIKVEEPKQPTRIEPIQKDVIDTPVSGKSRISFSEQDVHSMDKGDDTSGINDENKKTKPEIPELNPADQNIKKKKQRNIVEAEADDSPSINEKFKSDRTDISDKLKEKRIYSLVKEIDLNDKFWFINELFEGNSTLFNQILNELDTLRTYDDARDAILNQIKGKYDWKENKRASDKFMRLVKRRYA